MKYFTVAEMSQSIVAKQRGIDNTPGPVETAALRSLVANILDPLREAIGKPIKVNSGFRSHKLNRAIGGSTSSQHLKGEAADIVVARMSTVDLCKKIIDMGLPFDQLIEEHGAWVHVSFSTRNRREVLTARRNSSGRTYYEPGLTRS